MHDDMRFTTEKEFQEFMRDKAVKEHGAIRQTAGKLPSLPSPEEVAELRGKKPQWGNLRIILPFKLPTWNQLLAMDHWQRAKVRTWIKEQVSECIVNGAEWRTPTGSARKLLLTD